MPTDLVMCRLAVNKSINLIALITPLQCKEPVIITTRLAMEPTFEWPELQPEGIDLTQR